MDIGKEKNHTFGWIRRQDSKVEALESKMCWCVIVMKYFDYEFKIIKNVSQSIKNITKEESRTDLAWFKCMLRVDVSIFTSELTVRSTAGFSPSCVKPLVLVVLYLRDLIFFIKSSSSLG